ncbi:MAG: hypothetical protein NTY39_06565 [Campylobacterales bacterium]|nr:hypothetical protein [Campylobacterales bacterium]
MKRSLLLSLTFLVFGGCAANTVGVTPSNNSALHTVSPSSTSVSKGGAMQKGLDGWLKEEWTPRSEPSSSTPLIQKSTAHENTKIQEEKNESFTLQHYADKWKMYHNNQEKMNEGKAKEPSAIEKLEKLPVIGK